MIRKAYMKPEARATMRLHSGVVCASMTNVSGNEDFDYGGPGNDEAKPCST